MPPWMGSRRESYEGFSCPRKRYRLLMSYFLKFMKSEVKIENSDFELRHECLQNLYTEDGVSVADLT
jgi:hypothetical protein